jgi:hypothetical protein
MDGKTGTVPTYQWLAEVLSTPEAESNPPDVLIAAAQSAMNATNVPDGSKALALLGVGWTNPSPGDYQPFMFELTNVLRWPIFEFSFKTVLPADKDIVFRSSKPDPDAIIEGHLKHLGTNALPLGVGDALVAALREFATSDGTIGMDVLRTCIPKSAVIGAESGKGCSIFHHHPNLSDITYQFVPEDPTNTEERSPAIVIHRNLMLECRFGSGGIKLM